MTRGRFITFEGGEGVGKSTQIRRLVARLQSDGIEVLATREPGGSPGGEAIRDLVLNGVADRWSALTETLLMYAARRDHIERVIQPALARGDWVVCDRFADSSRAYQGGAGGVEPGLLDALDIHVLGSVWPDLTLVFDLPPDVGLSRAQSRTGTEIRFESKGIEYHARLRSAFLAVAKADPDRCKVIPASGSEDEVAALVWSAVHG